MAYRHGQTMRLEEVRDLGIEPKAILDIGLTLVNFIVGQKEFGRMLVFL